MSFSAGDVVTRLRFDQDAREADAYERRVDRLRKESGRGIKTEAKFDADTGGADQYEKRLKDVDRAHQDTIRGAGRLRGAFGSLFIGGAAIGGIAIAAEKIGGLAKATVDSASDINESISKNRTLFGSYAKDVETFAATSAKNYGISKKAALEYTGVFGNLLRAQGLTQKASADTSVEVTKLAADMASFSNTSIEDALQALQSGLVGESEPLRRFGVTLSADAIAAEAMSSGIVKVKKSSLEYRTAQLDVEKAQKAVSDATKKYGADSIEARDAQLDLEKSQKSMVKAAAGGKVELTAQQKTLATLHLVTKQTSAAQGDFAKTSGGLANQQRIASARIDDLRARIGGALLPVMGRAAKAGNTMIDALSGDRGKGATGFASRVTGVFKSMGEGIGVVVRENSRRLAGIGSTFADVGRSIVRAGGRILAAFKDTFGSSSGTGRDVRQIISRLLDLIGIVARVVREVVNRALPGIVTAFRGLATIIRGVIKIISGVLSGDFRKAWDGVKDIFRGAIKVVAGILRAASAPFRSAGAAIGRAIGNALQSAWDGILGKAEAFINKLIDVVNAPLKLLGIKTIGHVDLVKPGGSTARAPSGPGSPGRRAKGGRLDEPVIIMGEEAPRHPEWIIPTNPAYRSRAIGLWMQTARDLGIPGFKQGGVYSQREMEELWRSQGGGDVKIAGAVGMAESGGDPNAGASHPYHGLWQVGPGGSFDPVENARQAIAKWRAGGANVDARWKPWEAYTGPDGRGNDGPWRKFIGGGGIGGLLKGAAGAIAGAAGALMPDINWPDVPDLGPFTGIPRAALSRVKDYIADKAGSLVGIGGGGAQGTPGGGGLGTFDGLQVANWVIPALNYARSRGWGGHLTSGYRSHAYNVAQGRNYHSNHEETAYPGGAVDVGGMGIDARPVGAALNSALAGFSGGRRLVWGGPVIGDWGHFSATGHARGGRIAFEAFKKGGKTKSRRPTPVLSSKENRGITRSVARGERGIGGFEGDIQRLEREYGQLDTRFGLSDETFLVEHDDGSTTVDTTAVSARLDELRDLREKRNAIKNRVVQYRHAVLRLIKSIKAAVAKLTRALKAARGKSRQKERGGYRKSIADYNDRLGELRSTYQDLGLDIEDQRIDLAELDQERAEVRGTTGTPAAPADAADPVAPADAGGDPGAPADPVVAPPSAEDIARGVAEEFAAFQTARQDQFGAFGGNAERTARLAAGGLFPTGDTGRAAAGLRSFGAFGGDAGGGLAPAGGVTLEQHFAAPPPDPHIWSQQAARELGGAL